MGLSELKATQLDLRHDTAAISAKLLALHLLHSVFARLRGGNLMVRVLPMLLEAISTNQFAR